MVSMKLDTKLSTVLGKVWLERLKEVFIESPCSRNSTTEYFIFIGIQISIQLYNTSNVFLFLNW